MQFYTIQITSGAAVGLTVNKQTVMKKISVQIGDDTSENVMKNVIMKFQCNPLTHFQDTSTYKNVNRQNF